MEMYINQNKYLFIIQNFFAIENGKVRFILIFDIFNNFKKFFTKDSCFFTKDSFYDYILRIDFTTDMKSFEMGSSVLRVRLWNIRAIWRAILNGSARVKC